MLFDLPQQGSPTPYMYKLSEIGKQLFYIPREAAILAKKETERYEQWFGASEGPVRWSWEKYFKMEG
jgi:hypothetical protein